MVLRKSFAVISAIFLTISIAILSGCGSGPGSDGLESKSSVSLQLNWPEGYSFDSGSSQLNFTSSPTMMAAPDYVTSCKVTISGDDMSSVTLDVPLSTGEVSGAVTAGERRFDVVVDTNFGVSFTGSTTATLVPGYNGDISVNLSVNSPPELSGITVSPGSPKKRETVTLSVSVTDQDTTDAQNITWNGGGGRISGSGSSVKWSADRSGAFTITATSDDGHGGVVSRSVGVTVINTPPVISSITADKTSAVVGDVVNVSCSATDADGDTLSYSWSDGYGWSASGAAAQYKVTSTQVSALTCAVDDSDKNGKVSGSVGITAAVGVTPPSAPTGVTATAGDAQVTVTWSPVAGATSYNIYWSTAPGVTTASSKITGAVSPYVHTGRANGTTYYYAVTAVNAAGESALSAEVSATPTAAVGVTPPSAPTGVTATAGDAQVTVSWTPAAGATSYNIYWSTSPGVTTASNKIAGGSSPYVHTGLTNGAVYYYAVTAVNTAGESGLSAEVSATPTAAVVPVTPPGAPTTILISGGANSVGMTWSPVANATSYNLYWSTSPGVTTSTGTKIANVGTYNSQYNDYAYNHTGLTAGTTYYYILTAVNTAGESAPSPQASATPTAALQPPAPPTGVSAVGANAQVTVSWSASAGATSYNLYWSATPVVTTASTKIAGVTSPYIHTGLTNGTTYYYAVTAVNSAGESALSVEVSATPAGPGVNWTTQVSGTGNALYNVTFSGAQFVATGALGIILTSPDGVTWTARVSGTANGLLGVTWSGTQFVATGTLGTILTSPDGVTWTARVSGTANGLSGVTWSGTQFVAMGNLGTILTSPDGVTWTAQVSGMVDGESLYEATWSGTQFVVVGGGGWGTILTSPDGVTWTAQVSGGNNLSGVTWSGTQFVVVGDLGTVLTSPDGVTWTTQVSGTANWLYEVTWSGAQFVAMGDLGTILTSPDGVTWTARVSGTANSLYEVTWSGTKFVAVGQAGTILTSP